MATKRSVLILLALRFLAQLHAIYFIPGSTEKADVRSKGET